MYLELDGALVLVWVCVELLGNGLDCVLEAWVVLLLWVFEAVLDSVGLNELKTSLLRMLQIWILPRAWRSIGTCLLTGRLDPSRGTRFKSCTLKEKLKTWVFKNACLFVDGALVVVTSWVLVVGFWVVV